MNEKELDCMLRRIFSKDFAKLSEEERYEKTLEFIRAIDENNIQVMVGNDKKNMTSLLNVIKILGHETVARLMAQRISTLVSAISKSNLYGPEDIKRMREKVKNGTATEEDEVICKMLDEMRNDSGDEDNSKDDKTNNMPSFLYGLSFIILNYMKKILAEKNIENMSTSSILMVPMVLLAASNLVNDGHYANHGSQYKTIDDSADDLNKALTDSKEKAEKVIDVLSKDKDLMERLGLKGMGSDALAIIALSVSIMYCESSCMSSTTVSDIMEALSIDEAPDFNQQEEGKNSPPKFDDSMFSKSKFKEMTNDEGKSFLMDD